MLSCKVLVFVAISMTMTFIQAAPSHGKVVGMNIDKSVEKQDDNWMMNGEKENKDESMKLIELFMKCLKFLKEIHEENEKERKLHELFKYFVKNIEELKDFHQMLEDRLKRQTAEGKMDKALKKFLEPDVDADVDNGDEAHGYEEKMKKLFFIFMKFSAFITEMQAKEKESKEEKHKKQFLVFVKFMKFVKESETQLEMLGELSKIIESKFKVKFMNFKKCMEGHCKVDEDGTMDKHIIIMNNHEGEGKDEEERKFNEHLDMFLIMIKHLKEQQGEKYDGKAGIGGQHGDNDEGKDDDKKKIPVLELLMKLHKHVSERGKEFWGDKDLSPDEKMKKFVFFAVKCYKHMQELKALRERKVKIMELFHNFCNFLEKYENAAMTKKEYVKFLEWQKEHKNKVMVEEMKTFLKKVAIFKRIVADKKEEEAREESMKTFFDDKMKEHMEREKKDREAMMKKYFDERMRDHTEREKNDKKEMTKKFYQKMKEQNQQKDSENKMKAMLQILKHTDL